MKTKKKINWERKFIERSYVFFIIAALMWWCLALWSFRSATIYEWVIDKQKTMIQELRETDREWCINLFLKDSI